MGAWFNSDRIREFEELCVEALLCVKVGGTRGLRLRAACPVDEVRVQGRGCRRRRQDRPSRREERRRSTGQSIQDKLACSVGRCVAHAPTVMGIVEHA